MKKKKKMKAKTLEFTTQLHISPIIRFKYEFKICIELTV